MALKQNSLTTQISLIEEAMKNAGVWSPEVPEWIRCYDNGKIENIWQWLQFIHLPMRIKGSLNTTGYLAPQIREHINPGASHQQILQLIIELDSISSTLSKN